MQETQILVVEDLGLVAEDLQDTLIGMGYSVPAVASSGEDAINKAGEGHPDLVLMDIVLEGEMDGVEAAEQIRARFNIPVVYLTAHADHETLRRAKTTEPFGYILKPFEKRELETTIEIALYKHAMDKRLRESEQWFATTLRSVGDAVIATDSRGRVKFENAHAEGLTGWKQEEAIGKDIREVFKVVTEDNHTPVESPVIKALSERAVVGLTSQAILVARDGREIPIDDSTAPIIDSKGKVSGAVLIFRDISVRRRAQKELEESNRQLEEALAKLKATQQELIRQERMHALGQMASGIAHGFNNTLVPILGFSDILLSEPGALDNKAAVTRRLLAIYTAAQDAANVVRRLAEFYRFSAEDTLSQPVNVNQLVEQTISFTQPRWKDQAQASGISIRMETYLEEAPTIAGNEGELRETLANLIFNAVDAMPEGGTITIRTRVQEGENRTEGELVGPESHVVVEVGDTGTGMSEEVRERCYEPFFTTKHERGSGLGLAIARGVVQRHGGTIEIASELSRGTTFTIRLPVQLRQAAGERRQEAQIRLRPLRVLVVEEDPVVSEVIGEYLTIDGHTIDRAINGRTALEKLRTHSFDLVITDRAMAGMSGDQLAPAIKRIAPDLPVMMITGFGELMIVLGQRPEGVDAVVSKPVTQASLRRAVTNMIQRT